MRSKLAPAVSSSTTVTENTITTLKARSAVTIPANQGSPRQLGRTWPATRAITACMPPPPAPARERRRAGGRPLPDTPRPLARANGVAAVFEVAEQARVDAGRRNQHHAPLAGDGDRLLDRRSQRLRENRLPHRGQGAGESVAVHAQQD